jgi:CDP-diacylglycerol--glycerol-3-phosphate 3-phosphatidyltransferase
VAPSPANVIFNIPNVLTAVRLALSIGVFVLIPLEQNLAATIVFALAAGTDWIDGWWARKYSQVTKLGRIFDPFVDKILICGTFIYLAAIPRSGILPWMAVVVMGREMLVTVIRSFIEEQGGDFSAKTAGKWKMVLQCVAAIASLVALRHFQQSGSAAALPDWLYWTLHVSVWLALLLTIYSGLEYVFAAARILRPQGR